MSVTAELLVGAQAKLAPTPYDASNRLLSGRAFAYSSSAPSIATVDANGVVTGVAIGVTTISATAEGKSASTTIRVVPQIAAVVASRVVITPAGPATSLVAGQTLQLAAVPADANGNPLSNAGLGWASSNPAVATVNAVTGLVTGVAIGTAVITATVAGLQETLTLSVTQAQDGSLADLRGTIGDENIVSVWAFDTNVTLDGGGHFAQCDDARGLAYGPSLLGFGGTKPAYDAVNKKVTTDGSQNYVGTNPNALYGLARDRTRVIAYIGDARNTGSTIFPVMMSANGNAPYMGLMVTSGFVDGIFNPGSSPSAQEGTAVSAVFNEPGTTSGRLWIVERHARFDARVVGTLDQQACAYHFPGRVRHLRGDGGLAAADADGTSFFSIGLLPPTNFYPATSWGAVILRRVPLPSWRAALGRFATRLVGSTATITNPRQRIISLGDSITQGGPGITDQAHSYPALLQATTGISGVSEVSNRGVSSRTLVELGQASLGGKGLWLEETLADVQGGDIVTLMICRNDLGSISVPNVLLPLYTMLAQAVMALGARFVPITTLKATGITGQGETDRQTLNAALLAFPSQGLAWRTCNAAANANLQNAADVTVFVDGTHLTNLGCSYVAADLAATILA